VVVDTTGAGEDTTGRQEGAGEEDTGLDLTTFFSVTATDPTDATGAGDEVTGADTETAEAVGTEGTFLATDTEGILSYKNCL